MLCMRLTHLNMPHHLTSYLPTTERSHAYEMDVVVPKMREPKTQSMISRTNTCNTARFKRPFARDNKHKKLCQFMWLYLTYLLFDSHSLRVKSAEETPFQV